MHRWGESETLECVCLYSFWCKRSETRERIFFLFIFFNLPLVLFFSFSFCSRLGRRIRNHSKSLEVTRSHCEKKWKNDTLSEPHFRHTGYSNRVDGWADCLLESKADCLNCLTEEKKQCGYSEQDYCNTPTFCAAHFPRIATRWESVQTLLF